MNVYVHLLQRCKHPSKDVNLGEALDIWICSVG